MLKSLSFVLMTMCFGSALAQASDCLQGQNCYLPDCFCPTFDHPYFPEVKDIPQMVYFGFDDALTGQVDRFYRQLFTDTRTNPNGCPITMSLYVQDRWTDYNLVASEYQYGMEIGSHSVTHQNVDTKDKLIKEARGQRDNLVNKGKVAKGQVLGWRSPNLKTAGDVQPDVLNNLSYHYDISLTYTRLSAQDPIPWPYTLDYGYPYNCGVIPCPSKTAGHPGFWEVPINSLYDPMSGYPCTYVDSCRPRDEATALEYLWSNFLRTYTSTRAPFGLNMHAAWFFTEHNLRATHAFLDRLLAMDDVYVLSVQHVLEWMKNPIPVSQLNTLNGWGCNKVVPPTHPLSTGPPTDYQTNTTTITPIINTATSSSTNEANNPSPPLITTRMPSPTAQHLLVNLMTSGHGAVTSANPPTPASVRQDVCVQGINCHLPSCLCRSVAPPTGLDLKNTPQIVFLTFMGGVDNRSFSLLKDLLTANSPNPNGCPISATYFGSRFGKYGNSLRSLGLDLAMSGTGAPRSDNPKQFSADLSRLKNVVAMTGQGADNLGFRSWAANNALAPDTWLRVIRASGLLYDSSLMMSRTTSPEEILPWPYTLDFGWQENCMFGAQCPTDRFPGLWEVPIVPLLDTKDQFVCTFPDACHNQPRSISDTARLFWQNLNRNLLTNRAPMGIHLRKEWFSHSVFIPNLLGLKRFLNEAMTHGGIYVVSVEKMLDWMKKPTGLDQIGSLQSWKC